MTDKNDAINKKERFAAHQELISQLNMIKPNSLRGKDVGIDIENLDVEAELAKYPGIKATGLSLIIRLLTEPQKKEDRHVIDTDKEHAEQVYSGFMGLVIDTAPDAYDPEALDRNGYPRFPRGAWCKKGDTVVFQKAAGYYLYYNHPDGTTSPLFVVTEAAPDVIVDPKFVHCIKRK